MSSVAIADVSRASAVTIPSALESFLAERNIRSVADLAAVGLVSRLPGLPVDSKSSAVAVLDAHASLSVLPTNLEQNAAIIGAGFRSVAAIASYDVDDVVSTLTPTLGETAALRVYSAAAAVQAFVKNQYVEIAYSGKSQYSGEEQVFKKLDEYKLASACACEACHAAMGPLAYLVALVNYAVTHLHLKGPQQSQISLDWLTKNFYQPFDKLPATCEAVSGSVRQVRVAVEALRGYIGKLPPMPEETVQQLNALQRRYRLDAYRELLARIGTSFDEVRLARHASDEQRGSLADRIGIDLSGDDELGQLYLDPGATEAISEDDLESLFGLVATTRNPLTPAKAPPRIETWRLAHLRTIWRRQDFPNDLLGAKMPIVDPDIVGPDDLRYPAVDGESGAFDLWLRRRSWVDARLTALRAVAKVVGGQSVPDFEGLIAAMVQQLSYETASKTTATADGWSATLTLAKIDDLLAQVSSPDPSEAEKAADAMNDLHLTVEALTRVAEIRAKGASSVTLDTWYELVSILAGAQKRAMYEAWRAEESALGFLTQGKVDFFGPRAFWRAIAEPKAGPWPPMRIQGLPAIDPRSSDHPWLDPEDVRQADLPGPVFGQQARALWKARQGEIAALAKQLKPKLADIDAAFAVAVGPLPKNAKFTQLAPELDAGLKDATTAADTRVTIATTLYMTADDFLRLFALTLKTPSAAERNELLTILASAMKSRTLYPVWLGDEAKMGLTYWKARRAQLPTWRTVREERQAWTHALEVRSRPPLIDPDLLSPDDLKDPFSGAANFILGHRKTTVSTLLSQLTPLSAENVDSLTSATLGVSLASIKQLASAADTGEDIEPRLTQLGLTMAAFSHLLRIANLVDAKQPILESEWQDYRSILVQTVKQRHYADWREQEKIADDGRSLTLGPDWFRVTVADSVSFPPPPPRSFPPWRASATQFRDWQDTLVSRIDQERATKDGVRELVGATEAKTLPALRDALVAASDAPAAPLALRARWLSDRLLIDLQTGGCQKTTRVAQAFETVQRLLFAARNGLLEDAHPELALQAPQFDVEWPWIGSYASWRSAMFVFLYPENVLSPSLRAHQSGALRAAFSQLRGDLKLGPGHAAAIARDYWKYFDDLAVIAVEATCQTKTRVFLDTPDGEGRYEDRTLLYMFGQSPTSQRVYWCAHDPANPSGYAQSFWEPVPGLERVHHIVGAAVYRAPDDQAMYFFAVVPDGPSRKLVVAKYDLQQQRWRGGVEDVEAPKGVTLAAAVVGQRASEDRPPRLALRGAQGEIYVHRPNAGKDWKSASAWMPLVGPAVYEQFARLCAFVLLDGDLGCVLVRAFDGTLRYRLLGPPTSPGKTKDNFRWTKLPQAAERAAAFRWLATDDIVVLSGDKVLDKQLLIRTSQRVVVAKDPGGKTKEEKLKLLDDWFAFAFGVRIGDAEPKFAGKAVESFTVNDIDAFSKKIQGAREGDALKYWHSAYEQYAEAFGQPVDELLKAAASNQPLMLPIVEAFKEFTDPAPLDEKKPISRFATIAGAATNVARRYAYHRDLGLVEYPYYGEAELKGSALALKSGMVAAPRILGYAQQLTLGELAERRKRTETFFATNSAVPRLIQAYVAEAYYFLPVQIAMQLAARGEFVAALDWWRTVYDYRAPLGEGKIYYGLVEESSFNTKYQVPVDWLLDPLNPHAIAETRRDTYTRFTLYQLVRCLLQYADAEFTSDTAESVPRARLLYEEANKLLGLPVVNPAHNGCEDLIGSLKLDVGEPGWHASLAEIKAQMYQLGGATLQEAASEVTDAMKDPGPAAQKVKKAFAIVDAALGSATTSSTVAVAVGGELSRWQAIQAALQTGAPVASLLHAVAQDAAERTGTWLTRATALAPVNDDLPSAQPEIGSGAGGSGSEAQEAQKGVPHKPSSAKKKGAYKKPSKKGSSSGKSGGEDLPLPLLPAYYVPAPSFEFCVPHNPLADGLRLHADVNLYKIRTCRNIAGMRRDLEPYAAPTDTTSGMPSLSGGQLVLPGALRLRPTPFRYSALVARAKELVGIAQQVESIFLLALEKSDAERYSEFRARQDLQVARARVRLEDMRVREAETGIALARLQQEKAEFVRGHFQQLLDQGETRQELDYLNALYVEAGLLYGTSLVHAGSILAYEGSFKWAEGLSALAQSLSSFASATGVIASALHQRAEWARRRDEWDYARQLADYDARLGAQQVHQAEDHLQVAGQERSIALLQADQSEALGEFLARKFTNAELYEWMSGILGEVYAYFLRQATATAQLALNQLAFERQEAPPPMIQADYWTPPADTASGEGAPADRRGLTGSARLMRDIHELDQYAFSTTKRKLDLSKTISLAALAPSEFQRFRETGVMPFVTAMELFDRDFPGHYLRLIKRVRVSFVALIPVAVGVRATLETTGLSRVVIGGDIFQTVVVDAGPQRIALTSPRDATGVFEFEQQAELLFPFEGLGVEASWELRLPKAANLFDYDGIADVLITIEYTALESWDYAQQVKQSGAPTRPVRLERAFSFRGDLADCWYDLLHPAESETPMRVTFETRATDFARNLSKLRIERVVLYFGGDEPKDDVVVSQLLFTPTGTNDIIGGGLTAREGVATTSGGGAGAWQGMIGASPSGRWTLALPDAAAMRQRFSSGRINDVLLVLSYSGWPPEWPS